jgi:FlaA1/EpsC-like NDP-sugar epimerase
MALMAVARSLLRIIVNVALDGGLAALSVPVARWLNNPTGSAIHPLWGIPLGAITLLLAGIPFRLSLQYWRFAAMGEVLTVAASATLGALLFAGAHAIVDVPLPGSTFPAIYALTLLLFLGAARIFYRWRRGRPSASPAPVDTTSILLVGSMEDADLFLRALAHDRRQPFRVEGLLTQSHRQTGRRILGRRILGSIDDVGAVLDRLRTEEHLPDTLVFVTPDLSGNSLARVVRKCRWTGTGWPA